MCLTKYIFFFYFSFFLFCSAQAFTDKDGKGAQSDGREDLSFLNVKNSNFKKGKDAFKQAQKFQNKNNNKKAKKYFEKAIKYFVEANNEYSDNIEILIYLGQVYYKVGDFIMSEIYYQQGLNIDPKNNLINQKLGELYFDTKRINLAKKRLNVLKKCNCQEYLDLKTFFEKTN